jgi:SAM-dependent methyltransferase
MGLPTTANAFQAKAAQYARYRADYPDAVIEWLLGFVRVTPGMALADLGAGTGMLSKHLLGRVEHLYAVEPSPDMRGAAEATLGRDPRFTAVDGSAECTNLPDGSVDAVVCGHAFHYFDPEATRSEVERIARGRVPVGVVAYAALEQPNAFMGDYLRFIASVTPSELDFAHAQTRPMRQFEAFFRGGDFAVEDLGEVAYDLSWDALRGRFVSTSIAPTKDDPSHNAVCSRLRFLFEQHASNGTVPFTLRWTCVGGLIDSRTVG